MTHPGAFRLSNWFNTQVISDPQDLQAIYRLRYRVYCEERGFLAPADYPDRLERDHFDDHSVNFAAFDQDGRIAAAVRLVGPCLLYTSPSPRDRTRSRMPSSA